MVEERQRSLADMAFQPKCDPAEVHGQRVLVYAVDAMGYHVAYCFARTFWRRLVLTSPNTCEVLADTTRGSEQEVPRTAGRIAYPDRKQRRLRPFAGTAARRSASTGSSADLISSATSSGGV